MAATNSIKCFWCSVHYPAAKPNVVGDWGHWTEGPEEKISSLWQPIQVLEKRSNPRSTSYSRCVRLLVPTAVSSFHQMQELPKKFHFVSSVDRIFSIIHEFLIWKPISHLLGLNLPYNKQRDFGGSFSRISTYSLLFTDSSEGSESETVSSCQSLQLRHRAELVIMPATSQAKPSFRLLSSVTSSLHLRHRNVMVALQQNSFDCSYPLPNTFRGVKINRRNRIVD